MNATSFRFRKWYRAFAVAFLIATVSAAYADGTLPKEAALDSGFVTGHLVTVAGNNFFQYFIALWRDKPLSERYSLTVHERPDALRGSTIRIECLNRTIFVANLPNGRADIKDFSARAVDITYQNATQAEMQRLLFREPDLGTDEL